MAASLEVPPLVRLERVMMIVGPSGAGKTRFLELLEDAWRRHVNARGERDRLLERLAVQPDNDLFQGRLETMNKAVERVQLDGVGLPRLYRLTPQIEEALDGGRPATWWRTLSRLEEPDFAAASAAREVVVRHAARVKLDHAHGRPVAPDLVEQAERTFALVEKLTGMPADVALSRDPNEPPLLALGRRRAWESRLTDGLRMALSWAVLLSRAGERLRDAVVLVDTPERDLQPDIARTLIELLMAYQPAQLWVATACPALLNGTSPSAVLEVSHGKVRNAGEALPGELDRLAGGFRGFERTRHFADLSEDFAQRDVLAGWLLDPERPWAGEAWTLLDPAPDEGALGVCLARRAPRWRGYRPEPMRPWFRGDAPLATPDGLREGAPQVVVLFDVLSRLPLFAWRQFLRWLRERAGPEAWVVIVTPGQSPVARRRYLPTEVLPLGQLLGLEEGPTYLGTRSELALRVAKLGELTLVKLEEVQRRLRDALEEAEESIRARLSAPGEMDFRVAGFGGDPQEDSELALRAAQLRVALEQVERELAPDTTS
ncbi:MAG: ATP-binding protein [Alphaproteobacteria bacterium]|nr:ATP-binding protein [Alphaproteobacteria bacterium]